MRKVLTWLFKAMYGHQLEREFAIKQVQVYGEMIASGTSKKAMEDVDNILLSLFMSQEHLNVIVNDQGEIVLVNNAWINTFGYKPKDLIGRKFIHFLHPEDRQKTIKYFEDSHKKDFVPTPLSNRYIKKNGDSVSLVWMPSRTQKNYAWGSAYVVKA